MVAPKQLTLLWYVKHMMVIWGSWHHEILF